MKAEHRKTMFAKQVSSKADAWNAVLILRIGWDGTKVS
jgi:hypothetical protein